MDFGLVSSVDLVDYVAWLDGIVVFGAFANYDGHDDGNKTHGDDETGLLSYRVSILTTQ